MVGEIIHTVEICPNCGRRYNEPTDRQIWRDKTTIEQEELDEVCGRCEEGVEQRDQPL